MKENIERIVNSSIQFTDEDLQVFRSIQEVTTADLILPFPEYLFENEKVALGVQSNSSVEVSEKYVYPR